MHDGGVTVGDTEGAYQCWASRSEKMDRTYERRRTWRRRRALTPEEVSDLARQGLERLPLDGKRVIVLIPDGTRTMPMPLMFEILERELGPRVAALDFLVALGTHTPMSDEQLSRLIGRTVVDGRAGDRRIFNHRWDDPATFTTLGTIPARVIEELSLGRLKQDVPVALNRRSSSTTTSSSAARSFRTRSSASRAARSISSRASPRPRSSTSRTGWARSSRARTCSGRSTRRFGR